MLHFPCQSPENEQSVRTHIHNSSPQLPACDRIADPPLATSSLQPGQGQRSQPLSYWSPWTLPCHVPENQWWHKLFTWVRRGGSCRRLSPSTALCFTFGCSVLGSEENETRGHFWRVREGQQKGRKSCHTTAPVRNSIALFVQVSDFIGLCHRVNIVYGPILCLWITHSQRLFLHPRL